MMSSRILLIAAMVLVGIQTKTSANYQERAQRLINAIADDYRPPSMNIGDPEKYYWPKAIARFEKYGINDGLANSYVDTFRFNSPFHFTLVGMARIMSAYSDAPSMKKHKIQYLKEVFARTDSYNPWTGEGTENHITMSRTSGYIFAQHAIEYPDQFPEAHLRLQQMEIWIKQWAKRLYELGNGEWNSGIYEVYNLIGWLNLFDFAQNKEIKKTARAVLDYYATEIALHYSWGTTGGTEMRGSGAGLSRYNATNYLGWLWFGTTNGFPFGLKGNQYIQIVHPITSTYFPTGEIIQLGKKSIEVPSYFRTSRPSYIMGKPSFVKQFFYITDQYTLGSAVSPYGGWTGSTWQMINWRLAVKSEKVGLPYEVGGNGRYYDLWSGKTTNPFTQVVQHKNVLIQMTKTPENANEIIEAVKNNVHQWKKDWRKDFKKRFPNDSYKLRQAVVNAGGKVIAENTSYITFPEGVKIEQQDSFYMVHMNDLKLLVIPFQQVQPVREIKQKKQVRRILTDDAPKGQMCGFIIEIISGNLLTDVREKMFDIKKHAHIDGNNGNLTYQTLAGTEIHVKYEDSGHFQEATVDWGYGVETPQVMMLYPDFRQPDWPSGKGYGRIPSLKIDGDKVDFQSNWPICKGKQVQLINQKLEINVGKKSYRVDYSGNLPNFYPN